jgi:peptidyl-prolyl cis-trans isomerase B (cyclophilin B)
MIILHIQDYGEIEIQLDYTNAPNTCANFVSLVRSGFYDNLTFHRIIQHFMIQGGDPDGRGTGGPGYEIKGEFRSNGVKNNLSHKRGVISMARAGDPDSAGSQFFICDKDDLFLDGNYAAFGIVTKGMDVVDKIAAQPKNFQDKPLKSIRIAKAEAVDEPVKEVIKVH